MRLASRILGRKFRPLLPASRPLLLIYAAAMLLLAVPIAAKGSSDWMVTYVPTARHLAAGEDIYRQPHGYVYPPFQALLPLPLLLLPDFGQRLLWFVINAAALWIVLLSAWRLAGGPDLERSFANRSSIQTSLVNGPSSDGSFINGSSANQPFVNRPSAHRPSVNRPSANCRSANRREWLAAALGMFIGLTYLLNSLTHHQTDVLLAALIFVGIERLQQGAALSAATFFGMAAAMKCTPLLFALYLALRGKLIAALWLVGVAIGLNLLPDLIHSPPDFSCWLAQWWTMFLAPMAAAEHRPGVWASDIIFNQSILGAVNRWTMTGWTLAGGFRTFLIEPRLSPVGMKLAILGAAALLGGCSLALLIRARRLPPAARVPLECSLVLCGMLLFSPMSSPAHFGLLLLPACLLARDALVRRRSASGIMLILILLAAYGSNKDLLGGTLNGGAIYSIGLWHGSVMMAALAAWTGCCLRLASLSRQC